MIHEIIEIKYFLHFLQRYLFNQPETFIYQYFVSITNKHSNYWLYYDIYELGRLGWKPFLILILIQCDNLEFGNS